MPSRPGFTPQQRLLLLDTWTRSGLPAGEFASLVGLSKHTLYGWKKRFEQQGPAGLIDQPRGSQPGSRLPELTRRAILTLKQSHPEWGCQRISDLLARGPALGASPAAVAKVLHAAGYEAVEESTRPHPEPARRFERARANQLWQTDIFTFMLKRQNRRVYLVAFLDDHSRFVVAYGLHATASTALVREVLEAGIAGYGVPEEILTDNGPQYVTWRGKSQFARHLEKRGIKQIVSRPRRPQTLGKIERFWGTVWRECLESAIFLDLADARRRIGLFIDHYNFQRPHQALDGLVPADRFFGAASEVRVTLQARVAANALELARHGTVGNPFYLTGQLEGKPFSVHRAGERLVLTRSGEERTEWEIDGNPDSPAASTMPDPVCPTSQLGDTEGSEAPWGPGESPLDELIKPLHTDATDGASTAADGTEGGAP
jgi:transposase InsO family protein